MTGTTTEEPPMISRLYGNHRDYRDDGDASDALALAVALSAPLWALLLVVFL